MNYNKARAVINRVMQEGGYIGKCTYNKNQHCANLGSGGGKYCKTTMQKSCMNCRFATVGGSGERIIVAEKIIALEEQQDTLKRNIKRAIDKKDAEYDALNEKYQRIKHYENYEDFIDNMLSVMEGDQK